MSYETATTRSGDIAYTDEGHGPIALFIHGVGTSSHLWQGAIADLGDVRRCVAPDLPLHGRSGSAADQDFSLGGLADVVEDFCQALGATTVDLVANDTGGAIAQIFASRHPERVRTLALTNCEVHDNVPAQAFLPTLEAARAGLLVDAAAAIMAAPELARVGGLGEGFEHPDDLGVEDILTFLTPVLGTPERATEFQRLLVTSQTPEDLLAAEAGLRKLDVPALLIWGTGDQFFDITWAHWLKNTLPGETTIVEVDGAKLFFPYERPHDLTPHLRRHWLTHE